MLTIAIIDLLYFCNFNVCAKNDDRGNQKTFSMMARDVRIESLLFTHNINVSKKDSFVLAQYFVMISILHFSMIANRVEEKVLESISDINSEKKEIKECSLHIPLFLHNHVIKMLPQFIKN